MLQNDLCLKEYGVKYSSLKVRWKKDDYNWALTHTKDDANDYGVLLGTIAVGNARELHTVGYCSSASQSSSLDSSWTGVEE
jgi:hypothetical protein